MSYFTKHYNEPGTAPGELHSRPAVVTTDRADLIRYTRDTYHREENVDPTEVLKSPPEGEKRWIAIHGRPAPALLPSLEATLGLHPLALEDAIHAGQRSKLDDYNTHLFLVLQRPRWESEKLAIGQV